MSQSWKALAVPAILVASALTGCATQQQCGASGCCDSMTYAPVPHQMHSTYSPPQVKSLFEAEETPANPSNRVPGPPTEPTF
ncbi:hypothetical protein AB1L42_04085 [Thalassoglobus sp. JC818]|uniref:hypothetical protein n=1 Tax=Thalassoglobus sp. JC818 TaxID=3232136 RepID=UPI00345A5B7B